MYDPLKIVPGWIGSQKIRKAPEVEPNWIEMVDKCCNEKVTTYMKTVRELRAGVSSNHVSKYKISLLKS